MADEQPSQIGLIILTFALALVLSIVSMPLWAPPQWVAWLRPEWVALVLIYWVIALPERIGVGIAWLVGLLLDIVTGAPLGENALTLAVVAYCVLLMYQRLRVFGLWQQAGFVLAVLLLRQLVDQWVAALGDDAIEDIILPSWWLWFLPAVVSALLWPWLFVTLRFLQRR